MNDTKTKKRSPLMFLWITALSLIVLCGAVLLSPAAAKYLTEREDPTNIVEAYEFYFESNVLGEASSTIELAPGTTQVEFDLYNFADDLRFSELDINYTMTLTKPDGSAAALNSTSGTLTKDRQSTATITLSGLENGKTYTVTATGSNGFTKTLTKTFTVKMPEGKVYKSLTNNGWGFYELRVWTEGDARGTAQIDIPSNAIPNLLGAGMDGWNLNQKSYTDTTSFSGYNASRVYYFFSTLSYSASDFSVTVTDGTTTWTAQSGTP